MVKTLAHWCENLLHKKREVLKRYIYIGITKERSRREVVPTGCH